MTATLITGTSKGIGLTMAVELAKAGHDVYAAMRETSRADDLLSAARDAEVEIHVIQMDVLEEESVTAAIGVVTDESGQIDVLVNNAGIVGQTGPTEYLPVDAYREVMETNLYGPLRCMRAVLPSMRQRNRGAMINISSIGGVMNGSGVVGPYCASKFALEAVTEGLASQLPDSPIRVALVEPGFIYTPILDELPLPPASAPGSPYETNRRRAGATFRANIANASPPERVAETVLDILNGDTWRLRNPAGHDAERVFDRLSVHDRELPLIHQRENDTGWEQGYSDVMGHEIRL